MTDPGLNQRLRQRSRRAGIMIGISMLLTIAVCVGSFSVIYAGLDSVVGDFVSRGDPENTPTAIATEVAQAAPTQPAAAEPTKPPAPEPTSTPETQEAKPSPTPKDTDAFTPDYQLDSFGSVNLRSGPGVRFDVVTTITLEQPLQYLDEEQPTTDPEADELGEGDVWMKFRTEDGAEGWIRAIDVTEYVP